VNQGLAGGPGQELPNHVGVRDIGQRDALLGEAPDVLAESFPQLLPTVLEIPWVPGLFLSALEVSHEDFPQVRPFVNLVGWQVLEPCPCRVGQGQGQVTDNEVVIDRSSSPAIELVVLEQQGGVLLPDVPREVCRWAVPWREWRAADAHVENPRIQRVGARAFVLAAVMTSTAARVISLACHRLPVLVPAPPGVDGVACVVVGAEASPNGGVHGTFSLMWGLVDGHILTPCLARGCWPVFCPGHRDIKLSACCCTARSMSMCNFW
jgi:hypothetical protein